MARFEPETSGVAINCISNCDTIVAFFSFPEYLKNVRSDTNDTWLVVKTLFIGDAITNIA